MGKTSCINEIKRSVWILNPVEAGRIEKGVKMNQFKQAVVFLAGCLHHLQTWLKEVHEVLIASRNTENFDREKK